MEIISQQNTPLTFFLSPTYYSFANFRPPSSTQQKYNILTTLFILSTTLFFTSVFKPKIDSLPDYVSSPNVSEVRLGCRRSDCSRGRRSSHPHHASLPSASLIRLGGRRSHGSRGRHADVEQSPAYRNVFGLLEILRCVVLRS
jgi:hypothetical protein